MRNPEHWQPTKFVLAPSGLRASRSPEFVSPSSRYITDLVARQYELSIRAHATGRLLDLGCGNAPLFDVYRHLVAETICVDWSNTLHPNQFIDLSLDLNEPLPFDDESFDTILLTDVLEHIAEPAQLMREIGRLLRPRGKLILGVPFLYSLHEQPHDYYRYTEYALRRFCKLSELAVLQLKPYGGLTDVFIDLTSKGIAALPTAIGAGLRPLQNLLPKFAAVSVARRFSEATASTFPLGYVLVAQK
jgi:SAM-dependent methyltransferase